MIGYVNTGGGGIKTFAFIVVTYPEDSICTCTDGIKTFSAKDSSGTWVFAIPYAGTWTVSVTKGASTRSKAVSIVTKGQSEKVAFGGMLYDSGNEFTEATGGWTGAGTVWTHNPEDGYMQWALGSGYSWSTIYTANKIDHGGYEKMNITYEGIARAAFWDEGSAPEFTVQLPKTTAPTTQSVNIPAELESPAHFGFYGVGGYESTDIKIYKVELT